MQETIKEKNEKYAGKKNIPAINSGLIMNRISS